MSYVIYAGTGERPPYLTGQRLEKGSGQTIPMGPEVRYNLPPQTIGVPNRAQAWGCRVLEDGKVPNYQIDVKDPRYKGQIKFLPWGDKNGYLIDCRYLKGYNTLDVQYQEIVLGFKVNENDASAAEVFYLMLKSGYNEFNEVTDKLKTEMLKISPYNSSSVYKNPDYATNPMFYEKDVEKERKEKTKVLSNKTEAFRLVSEASNENTLERLSILYTAMGNLGDAKPADGDLLGYMQDLADNHPDLFMGKIKEYRTGISNVIEKAKSYQILDLEVNGTIAAGKAKKEIIATNVPGKGEEMLKWMVTNFTEVSAHEAFGKLKKIVDNLK